MDIQTKILGMSSAAHDTLRCLFFHGPTWDGDVPSKSGRDELVDLKLADRMDGWQWLTREGVDFSLTVMLLGDQKENRMRNKFTEETCPGHVASRSDPKVCGRCGVHIDSFRPDDDVR